MNCLVGFQQAPSYMNKSHCKMYGLGLPTTCRFACACICERRYIYKVLSYYFICWSSFENQRGVMGKTLGKGNKAGGSCYFSIVCLVPSKSLNSRACWQAILNQGVRTWVQTLPRSLRSPAVTEALVCTFVYFSFLLIPRDRTQGCSVKNLTC